MPMIGKRGGKKNVQPPKILDHEVAAECSAGMWAVFHKQRRKVSDFQRKQILIKGPS